MSRPRNVVADRCMAIAAVLMTSTALAPIIACNTAYAQSAEQVATVEVNVPAQPLSNALIAFSRQTKLQVFAPSALATGKTSAAVSGKLAPTAALQQILSGTGLSYSISGSTATIVDRVAAPNDAAIGADGATVIDMIRVTGGGGGVSQDTPFETAGSSAVLSQEQLERSRGTSAGDFLGGVPGVINGDNRNSGALDVNIRGMQGQGRVPVIVDGAAQEVTVYRGYNGSASRSYIDPDFISKVEIEKGASMGADATGASGGVVRMSTLNVHDILTPGKDFGVRLKGSFNTNSSSVPAKGTYGGFLKPSTYNGTMPSYSELYSSDSVDRPGLFEPTGGAGSVAAAATSEYIDVLGAFARRRNGNYHAGRNGEEDAAHPTLVWDSYGNQRIVNGGLTPIRAGEEVLNTSYTNESWLLKGTIRVDGGHSLELGWNSYESRFGEIHPTQFSQTAAPYQAQLSDIDLNTYTARYRWKPDDNDLIDLKVDTFYMTQDLRVNAESIGGGNQFYQNNVFIATEKRGVTASNTSTFGTSYGDFKLSYGGSWSQEDMGYPDGVTVDDVAWRTREGQRKEQSGFASLEWQPVDWLTLNGSTRYSHFSIFDESDETTRTDGGWSPVGTITFKPLEGLQVYGKYGSVLRMPSAFETLKSDSFVAAVQNYVSPERANNGEIGVNYLMEDALVSGDKLRLHGAFFNNHINNYITRANVYGGEYFPGFPYYQLKRLNLDHAKMRGFEIATDYDTGDYFAGVSWNHYTNMEFCVPEGTLLMSDYSSCAPGGIRNSYTLLHIPPKDTVTINAGARFLDDKLTIGGKATFTGERFVDGVGDGSVLGTGGGEIVPPRWNAYTLIDVFASYKINETATLDFAVDNLTDRYYLDALSGSYLPGPGRTVRGSLTVKF